MSENPKNFPPIYNTENAKNPKDGSVYYAGDPDQQGIEIPSNGGNGGNGGNALVDDLDGTSSNDEARSTGKKGGLG
jgi:hypothetical protein